MTSPLFGVHVEPPDHHLGAEIEWACRQARLSLFPWQMSLLAASSAITRGDEHFLRNQVTIIAPRRNGKTLLVLARILTGCLAWNERILFTSHTGETSRHVFTEFLDMINRSSPWLKAQVKRIGYGRGAETVEWVNGGRLTIRARTASGGRGIECDCLILDEGLELTEDHVSALSPLTAKAFAQGRGQVWLLSSAGHGNSLELARARDRGRNATHDDGLLYAEWTVDREADPADPKTWHAANPSLGTPILSERFIRSQFNSMMLEAFGREHLGWWTHLQATPLLPPGSWNACQSDPPIIPPRPRVTWGCEVQDFGERAVLVQAVDLGDGKVWTETLGRWHEPNGLDGAALAAQVARLYRGSPVRPTSIAGDEYTTGLLLDHLKANRLPTARLSAPDVRSASGLLLTSVVSGRLSHPVDHETAAELESAGQSKQGDGLQRLSRRQSTGPSTAAFAVAAALHSLLAPVVAAPKITLVS